MTHELDLGALQEILDRIDQLLLHDYDFLSTYWDRTQRCFFANEIVKGRVSVTTTCFCIFALLQDTSLASRFEDLERGGAEPSVLVKLAEILRDVEWNSEQLGVNNIYTTPIVIACLGRIHHMLPAAARGQVFTEGAKDKIDEGIRTIVQNVETHYGAACYQNYPPSAYLTFWSFEALGTCLRENLVKPDRQESCRNAQTAMGAWATDEVHRQIAYQAAGDTESFDAMQLGYGLTIYLRTATSRSDFNKLIVTKALGVIFGAQTPGALWPKGHPIFHYQTRGSVYAFGFEVLDLLLSEEIRPDFLRPHLNDIEKALRWAEVNVRTAGETKGWRSNHLGFPGGAEAWSTAAVIIFLRLYKQLVNHCRHDQVLTEFHAVRVAAPDESRLAPRSLFDGEIPVASGNRSLKEILRQNLIDPHKPGGDESARKYSAVFYGPPGTAKTTLAEAIAYALGWPYIYLQTSDFSGGGFDQITGRAKEIFARLGMLNTAVILFDEVEEFVRNRDDAALPPASKMITTSMLSLIQELRRKKNVLFIVTTNFLKNFDAAITRPGGRFDLLLLVPPPSLAEKKRMFKDRLAKHDTLGAQNNVLSPQFDAFVNEKQAIIEFFAFSEWSSFVEVAIQRIAATTGADAPTILRALFEERKDGITICGALREDYLASRAMVRLW